jgi:hypothetical protein
MNKRLEKRDKHKVLREGERVKLSQPDLRTPEQLKAARESSVGMTRRNNNSHERYSALVKPGAAS